MKKKNHNKNWGKITNINKYNKKKYEKWEVMDNRTLLTMNINDFVNSKKYNNKIKKMLDDELKLDNKYEKIRNQASGYLLVSHGISDVDKMRKQKNGKFSFPVVSTSEKDFNKGYDEFYKDFTEYLNNK